MPTFVWLPRPVHARFLVSEVILQFSNCRWLLGKTVVSFSNWSFCLKPERGLCDACTRDTRLYWRFYAFHFSKTWDITGKHCWGHIFVGEALNSMYCIYCKRSHAATTTPAKERSCVALLFFFHWQSCRYFDPFCLNRWYAALYRLHSLERRQVGLG